MDFTSNFKRNIVPFFQEYYEEGMTFQDLPEECYTGLDIVDLTDLDVYSLDPEGSTDADDAFSLYLETNESTEQGNIYLIIHIANPTEYIRLNSEAFSNATTKITTRYPGYDAPLTLFPKEIEELCTLQPDETETMTRPAISIKYLVDRETLHLTYVDLFISTLLPKKKHKFSYLKAGLLAKKYLNSNIEQLQQNASTNKEIGTTIAIAYHISEQLRIGFERNLNSIDHTFVIEDTHILLKKENMHTIQMKSMIEEFAIFTNYTITTQIGNLCSFYRNQTEANNPATFSQVCQGHTGLRLGCYSQFTSPLRRIVDCFLHYDIRRFLFQKKYGANIDRVPESKLNRLENRINETTTYMRKLDLYFNKYKMIQYLYENKNCVVYGYLSRNNDRISLQVSRIINNSDMYYIPLNTLSFTDDNSIPPSRPGNYCQPHQEEEAMGKIICCLIVGEITNYPIIQSFREFRLSFENDDSVLPNLYQEVLGLMNQIKMNPHMILQTRKNYRIVQNPVIVKTYDIYGNIIGQQYQMNEEQVIEDVPVTDNFGNLIYAQATDPSGQLMWF